MATGATTPGARLRVLAETEFRALTRELAAARSGKDGGVHRARKGIQRLRALVRLLAPGEPDWARREDAALKRLRRKLGKLRDAAVRLDRIKELSTRALSETERARLEAGTQAFKQALRAEWAVCPSDAVFWTAISREGERLHARLSRWPVDDLDARQVRKALERARRQLCDELEESLGCVARNARHDLRRRLRRYATLRRCAVQVLGRRDAGAKILLTMARDMGDEGDLWMAITALRTLGHATETQPLRRLLEDERRAACKRHDGELVALRRRWLVKMPKPASRVSTVVSASDNAGTEGAS